MSETPSGNPSTTALEVAWQLHRQFRFNAAIAWKWYQQIGTAMIALAVAAPLLAIAPCLLDSLPAGTVVSQISRVALVLVGLGFTVLFALVSKLQDGQYWSILDSGSAEIERAIYLYRTLLQSTPERAQWLNEQVTAVQRQVLERLGNNWVVRSWEDSPRLPAPFYLPGDPTSGDWLAQEYLHHRLTPYLEHCSTQLAQMSATRNRYRAATIASGGLAVLMPILGSPFSTGVAVISALELGLVLWLFMARLDALINTYSQLNLGLAIVRDNWQSLTPPERTGQTFFRLVVAAEELIWGQYRQMSDQVYQSIRLLRNSEPELITQLLNQPVPPAIDQALRAQVTIEKASLTQVPVPQVPLPEKANGATPPENGVVPEKPADSPDAKPAEAVIPTVKAEVVQPVPAPAPPPPPPAKRGRPHAFIVMPFGRKRAGDGRWIDFNSIYEDLIKPAVEDAGFESFRADEEASSGDILTDMFQELLLADMVVADLSIDNANVYYELGIRHAMRRRGIVHIQAGRAYMPFDIFNVRTLPYHCDDSGRPDPDYVEKDKQALSKMLQATWNSERNRIHSPIFNLLDGLVEPDRKTLRTPLATGYWEEYIRLQERIEIAQRQKRIGDVLLLSEEVQNPLIKEDIIAEAGRALKSTGNSALALKEYRQGLKINPENVEFRCEEAFHLSRLKQPNEAIVKLERLLVDEPTHIEAMSYLARIYKDLWKEKWVKVEDTVARIQAAYDASHFLQKAIENYLRAYRIEQNHYYSGINALTLIAILGYLAERVGPSGDAEEEGYLNLFPSLKGAVQFCLSSEVARHPNDFWAAASVGDLAVCTAEDPKQVANAYKKALTALWNNTFALEAILGQLKLLNALEFRPEFVHKGIAVLEEEIRRYERRENANNTTLEEDEPTQVILFAGHMVDSPRRRQPRFPAAMEEEARLRIEAALDKLGAQATSIAIAPGIACGGDILFIEACLKRGMKVEAFLPFEQAEFIQGSVSFAGDQWVERFYAITNHHNVTIQLQPDRLGAVPTGDDPYERNNRWALYSALAYGIDRTRLIVLWNGKGGDAPGGTADMVQQVRQLGGIVEHIDTTKFDYWKTVNPAAGELALVAHP